jgi:hypothetical protein
MSYEDLPAPKGFRIVRHEEVEFNTVEFMFLVDRKRTQRIDLREINDLDEGTQEFLKGEVLKHGMELLIEDVEKAIAEWRKDNPTVVPLDDTRLAPVQASKKRDIPAGTVEWWEHEECWVAYNKRFPNVQSAERLAERGGFGIQEYEIFLGHLPTTWRAR